MIRRSLAALVLVFSVAAAASGGDDAPVAPAAPPAAKPAPARGGFTCRLQLHNGRTVSGVVREDGMWERRDAKQGWVACGKDDPGASVRLSYVGGREGSMVVSAKDVKSAENLGPLEAADLDKITQAATAAEAQAQKERDLLRRRSQERRVAEAAAQVAKVKEAAAAAEAAEAAAKAKVDADLLAKFPPKEWSAERRDAIGKRRLLLHINPNDLEQAFLDNYEAWSRAALAAMAAEVKDLKDTTEPKKPADAGASKDKPTAEPAKSSK